MSEKFDIGKIFPPGHFYSPIPDLKEVRKREDKIFRLRKDEEIRGLHLNIEQQLKHLSLIEEEVVKFDFPIDSSEHPRFFYNNGLFSGLDSLAYFSFIIHYKPNTIVEVGCGFSSLLSMEVNKKFFNNNI